MGYSQLLSGSLFANRFQIDSLAGSGGMGTVYRARDVYSGDLVALKLLDPGNGGRDAAERIAREAHLLAELRHPGIVSYISHGQTPDGQCFLAMEWLGGQDLGQRLLRGPLTLRECVLLLGQVAEALSSAHQRGIIHRDLKPSNLFLMDGQSVRVKILDFGIARRLNASRVLTRTGMVVGTPEYMAPEQARGSSKLTPAVDMFALGCVLYECLTGQPPFIAEHIAAVLVRILFEEPMAIEEQRPDVPVALQRLLGQLLDKNPAQRLADARALIDELAKLEDFADCKSTEMVPRPQPRPISFAESEQGLFSVVLAATPEEMEPNATQPGSTLLLEGAERRVLTQALIGLGVTSDFLANGALVITVPMQESAHDQVARAARAALFVKERWTGAIVSLATGRGGISGRTAIGEVVELAARILQKTTHSSRDLTTSGVYLDALSAKLLEGRFSLTSQPSGALLVAEEKEVDASRPLLGKPTPCVGRDVELGMLDMHLSACINESEARAALITAPPGIGKSRLRHEFLRRVEERNEAITVLSGRGDLMGADAPYGILGQAIRKYCGLVGGEPLEEQQRCLAARIGAHLEITEQERIVIFVGELASVPFPQSKHPMLLSAREDPRILRDRIRQAFSDWMRSECQHGPVLLVLDDLQWGDQLSVALLDHGLRELAALPLYVVALARPEVHLRFPKLWQRHHLQEVVLRGLSRKACERLIIQVLGTQLEPGLITRVVDQAAGNALYLEELIRAAAEGHIESQPDTVLAMLQARLGRFDSGPRRAVRAASVFGQTFWLGGVASLLGLGPDLEEAELWLETLREAEVIQPNRESRLREDREYSFRHALVRDAAYGLLTENDLLAGHGLAGAFLEKAGDADPIMLAEHFHRGGLLDKAVLWYMRAAEKSFAGNDLPGAMALAECGIACGAQGEQRGILRGLQCRTGMWSDKMAAGYTYGMESWPLLPRGGIQWCKLMSSLLPITGIMHAPERFNELVAEFMGVEPDPAGRGAYMEAASWLATVFSVLGQCQAAQSLLTRMDKLVQQLGPEDLTARAWWNFTKHAYIMYFEPDPWARWILASESYKGFEQAGDLRNVALVKALAGLAYSDLGFHAEGEQMARDALLLSKRVGEAMIVMNGKLYLALTLARRGRPADADEIIALCRELIETKDRNSIFLGLAHASLAVALMLQGQLDRAEAEARRADEELSQLPGTHCQSIATLVQILVQQGQLEAATTASDYGLSLIARLGGAGCSEVAIRLAAAEVYHAKGEHAQAESMLKVAIEEIRRRAIQIPNSEIRQLFTTKIPEHRRAQELAKSWLGMDAGSLLTAS